LRYLGTSPFSAPLFWAQTSALARVYRPSESEYESKPLLERSQLMPGCMTYGLR